MTCDHPVDVAVLRLLMAEPGRTFTPAEVDDALAWLGETPLAHPRHLPSSLRRLENAGLVVRIQRPPGLPSYQFKRGASVRLRTGGIDPLAVDPEELLEAFSWRHGRRAEYDPKGWKREKPGATEIDRALTQCSSVWQYGARLARL